MNVALDVLRSQCVYIYSCGLATEQHRDTLPVLALIGDRVVLIPGEPGRELPSTDVCVELRQCLAIPVAGRLPAWRRRRNQRRGGFM